MKIGLLSRGRYTESSYFPVVVTWKVNISA